MGLKFNWIEFKWKWKLLEKYWKSTCEYVIEKKPFEIHKFEKTHFHFHKF
jgi:hypothetical protein